MIDEILSLPVEHELNHCDVKFNISKLDIYGTCPICGTRIKSRAFTANHETQDIIDAVIEWTLKPEAWTNFEKRRSEILRARADD